MAFLTVAGEEKIAYQQGNSLLFDVTHFVLANITGLGAEPVDRIEAMPAPGDIVDTKPVSRSGYVNANQVVYSLTLDSTIGDYTFNWVGLKDADDVLVAVVHLADPITKTATAGAIDGNNLVRNFLLQYTGLTATTAISAPAETWQIDFTTRLLQIDERERLSNFDIYGQLSAIDTGFKVTALGGGDFSIAAGVCYVGGIRCDLADDDTMNVSGLPKSIWIDASLQGDLNGVDAVYSFTATAATLADYTDGLGFKHYLAKIADISAGGVVTDTRIYAAAGLQDYATKKGVQDVAYSSAVAGGTVDAITASFSPAITELSHGMTLSVRALGANTSTTPTFKPDGMAAKTIVKGNNFPLSPSDISGAGYWAEFKYDETFDKWILQNPATGIVSSASIQGGYKKLKVSTTGKDALISISADEIVLKNALNNYTIARNVDIDLDTSALSLSGDTFYDVWVASNGVSTISGLALQDTAPSFASGYNHIAQVSTIKTDNTANHFPLGMIQNGSNVQVLVDNTGNTPKFPVLSAGINGSGILLLTPVWAEVYVRNTLPSKAEKICFSINCATNSAGAQFCIAPNDQFSGLGKTNNPPPMMSNGYGFAAFNGEFCLESDNLYWLSSSAWLTLFCIGWELNL